jgi:RNA polymerase sigma-70 factor, ECF subfamily
LKKYMAADDQAFDARQRLARWVCDHARAIRGYVFGLVGRWDVADDVVQEVFERAWRARDRYEDAGRERAFLLKIADRLVIDRSRRLAPELNVDDTAWSELEPAAMVATPLDSLVSGEASAELEAALAQLSPHQRRVLLLRYFSDMSFDEIATTLDCPLSTALSHCRRGLMTMRKLLTTSEQ